MCNWGTQILCKVTGFRKLVCKVTRVLSLFINSLLPSHCSLALGPASRKF